MIDSRMMFDPETFRRVNLNFLISILEVEDKDILIDSESNDSDDSDEEGQDSTTESKDEEKELKPEERWVKDEKTDTSYCLDVPTDEEDNVV